MTASLHGDKWRLFALVAGLSFVLPIIFIAYVLITTRQESVVFFEHTHPYVSLLIILYYLLLTGVALAWLTRRFISIVRLKHATKKNELQHLQGQVNPHFFFNILNTLYGLVEQDRKQAQRVILRLSDLMRYGIYDGQAEQVTIAEELSHIENFVALHQLRYHKKIDITIEQEVADEQLRIMPLLFIMLVENAFKHGVERLRQHAYVHIQLKATDDELHFRVTNNFDPEAGEQEVGVGLNNLRRRLALRYPKQHRLELSKTADVFQARLSLSKL